MTVFAPAWLLKWAQKERNMKFFKFFKIFMLEILEHLKLLEILFQKFCFMKNLILVMRFWDENNAKRLLDENTAKDKGAFG